MQAKRGSQPPWDSLPSLPSYDPALARGPLEQLLGSGTPAENRHLNRRPLLSGPQATWYGRMWIIHWYHNRTVVILSVNLAIIGTRASKIELLGSGRGVTHVWGYNLVPFIMARLTKKAGRPISAFFTKKMIWSPMMTLNVIISLTYLANEALFQCN